MSLSKGIWRLRWAASVSLLVAGCFWVLNTLMFPKDQWFWEQGHWIFFILLPIGALTLGFLLYPKANPVNDSSAENDVTDLNLR